MTNTYPDDAPYHIKLLEEIRCIRCVNERILRAINEGEFPPYQMEKFSGSVESRIISQELNKTVSMLPEELFNIRDESEQILSKLNTSLYVDYILEKNKTDKAHEVCKL